MATVINNPGENNNSWGYSVGVVLLLAVVLIFVIYGLPILRQSQIEQAPQINVPGEIDVNINEGQGGGGN
ncbi:MAG: hypothetical protein UV73_C0003G0076 [Candidatus Gottesmanbacteria bacterium GW2011_GWA2_43_14]|uniref:Uncharacterized protein n=1 Tax=Candidatus Gottesmanbacteria bacterium GW2011_GWA2_43_14 TaxID=1618443 RepID=A0A0G1DKH5_9BACT|nr:MAG: hypothetical protein UV73_C0003G0076 [Candidatus Gottesmanbacteria bacterium GW2011_GWA2_43_14]